jgi:hypothetical protein
VAGGGATDAHQCCVRRRYRGYTYTCRLVCVSFMTDASLLLFRVYSYGYVFGLEMGHSHYNSYCLGSPPITILLLAKHVILLLAILVTIHS